MSASVLTNAWGPQQCGWVNRQTEDPDDFFTSDRHLDEILSEIIPGKKIYQTFKQFRYKK